MHTNTENKMKKYVQGKITVGGCWMFGMYILLALLLWAMIAMAMNLEDYLVPFICTTLLALFFGSMAAIMLIKPRQQAKRIWIQAAAQGKLAEMTADFEVAQQAAPCGADKACSELILLGNTYIFGKFCGLPLKYADISALQVVTLKNKGVTVETTLYAIQKTGPRVPICRAFNTQTIPAAMTKAISAIIERNPQVVMK